MMGCLCCGPNQDACVPDTTSTCPRRGRHTPCPSGYIARYEWAMKMLKTHRQVYCEGCGLLMVWLPKAEANRINREHKRAVAKIVREQEKRDRAIECLADELRRAGIGTDAIAIETKPRPALQSGGRLKMPTNLADDATGDDGSNYRKEPPCESSDRP